MKSFKELVDGAHFFRKQLTNEKFVNLFTMVYNFTGRVGLTDADSRWNFASRKNHQAQVNDENPDAVMIVPIWSDGDSLKVVLTKEFRYSIMDWEWSFPAGLIDPGETIEMAARRELKEETGLDYTKVLEIAPNTYSSAGITDESSVMIFVLASGEISTKGNQHGELIEVVPVEFGDVKDLIKDHSKKFSARAWLILRMIAGGFKLPKGV